MRHLCPIVLVIGMVLPPVGLRASDGQQLAQGSRQGGIVGATSDHGAPFQDLFQGSVQPQPSAGATPRPLATTPAKAGAGPRANVVCGMTLVPTDPATDPGIRAPHPADGPKPTVRAVPPPSCEQDVVAGSSRRR